MTQEQFYYCLKRIYELRNKISKVTINQKDTNLTGLEASGKDQVDFNTIQQYADDKEDEDIKYDAVHALGKELLAQEDKIREFVPQKHYNTPIEASIPDHHSLYVIVSEDKITIEKAGEKDSGEERNFSDRGDA